MSGSFNSLAQQGENSYDGYLMGTVVDNQDPEHKQRIKVFVPNLMEGSSADLPWVEPLIQSNFGISDSAVTICVPIIGSRVAIELQGGDLHYGLLHGSLQTKSTAVPAELITHYPNRRGWLDPAGNLHYIDGTPGAERIYLRHRSGTELIIEPNGRVIVTSVEKIELTAATEINMVAPKTTITSDDVIITATSTVVNSSDTAITGSSVEITAPSTTVTGNTTLAGPVAMAGPTTAITGSLKSNGKDVGDTHYHNVPGVRGGPDTATSTPPVT